MNAHGFAASNLIQTKDLRAEDKEKVTPEIVNLGERLKEVRALKVTYQCTDKDKADRSKLPPNCNALDKEDKELVEKIDIAIREVKERSDPLAMSLAGEVTWVTRGYVRPESEDVNKALLLLLTLFPLAPGVILMVARK